MAMEYCSALDALNSADSIEPKLDKILCAEEISEEIVKLINETFGILFSASKEIKNEEFYHVYINNGNKIIDSNSLWHDENGVFGNEYLTLFSDPISPFLSSEIAEGDSVTLSTYRKSVSDNPSAILSEGFPEDSGVFNILKCDGLSDIGKDNYLKICRASGLIFSRAGEKKELALCIKMVLENDERSNVIYEKDGSSILYAETNNIRHFYSCTSNIFCRVSEISEDKVVIEPLYRSVGQSAEDEIQYEEFGEVGKFSFEMNDYK